MRRFLFLINPVSGTRGKGAVRESIEARCRAEGVAYRIEASSADGSYREAIALIASDGITDVVIAGGDGTINGALNALRHLPVQFGIIPCGSGNGLAFSAGLPKDVNKSLDIIFRESAKPTDAFLINGSFACMLCGLGFDAQVAHDFANDPRRGLTTYIRKTVANYFSAKAHPFTLEVSGRAIQTEAYFISVANSNQFGNHFTIAPKASLSDGLLDIVVMARQNKLALLLRAFMQVGGYNRLREVELLDEKASLLYFQTPSISIRNESGAPLHIDGDPVLTADSFTIKTLPSAFRLIRP